MDLYCVFSRILLQLGDKLVELRFSIAALKFITAKIISCDEISCIDSKVEDFNPRATTVLKNRDKMAQLLCLVLKKYSKHEMLQNCLEQTAKLCEENELEKDLREAYKRETESLALLRGLVAYVPPNSVAGGSLESGSVSDNSGETGTGGDDSSSGGD